MSNVYIGTSGFSYPHWKGIFYPEDLPQKDWFKFYCQNFSTVEINSSFYHLPKRETFEKWRREAGSNFVFSIKGWRWITHIKKLKNCQEELKRFLGVLGGLGRLGKNIILWQLPPGLSFDRLRLKKFLEMLSVYSPPRCEASSPRRCARHAFEFRNESWLNPEVFDLLSQNNSAIVFQDFPEWPITEKITAGFVYLRFHGKTSLYSSCYTKKELEDWAKKIKKWIKQGLDVYTYFNNDAMGYAVENAKKLISNVKTQISKPNLKSQI